jgi:hypothetical protein
VWANAETLIMLPGEVLEGYVIPGLSKTRPLSIIDGLSIK